MTRWTETISARELADIKEVKHRADIDVNDIVYLDTNEFHDWQDARYVKVVCIGYCGKDEFFGRVIETGVSIAWCDGDRYKIVGKQLSI